MHGFAAGEIFNRQSALADVVGVCNPDLCQLVLDDGLDDLAVEFQPLAGRDTDAGRLARTGVVRQSSDELIDLHIRQAETEPIAPLAELEAVVGDRPPVDLLGRRRQQGHERRAVDIRQAGVGEQRPEEITVLDQVLHLIVRGVLGHQRQNLLALRESGCRHDSPPFCYPYN